MVLTMSELIRTVLVDFLDQAVFDGYIPIDSPEQSDMLTTPFITITQKRRSQFVESRLTIEQGGGFTSSLRYGHSPQKQISEQDQLELNKAAAEAYKRIEGVYPKNYNPETQTITQSIEIEDEEGTQVGGTNEDIIKNMPKPTA
jgi:hypothetical protein